MNDQGWRRRWAFVGAGLIAAIGGLPSACSNDVPLSPEGRWPADATVSETANDSATTDGDAPVDGATDGGMDSAETSIAACDASLDDPRNCGRCQHDCIGGACEAGVCKPWSILDTPASDIASDNTQVFWVDGRIPGTVAGCARTGCDAGTILIPDAPVPAKIAIDNNRVYYTTYIADGGYLAACAKGGCDGGPTILSGGHRYPSWLLVDSNAVFYDVDNSSIFECTLPSCGGGSSAITTTAGAQGLAQEWTPIHWTETSPSLWSCQKANCNSTRKLIASGLTSLRAVAGYGGNVFAVQGGANGKVLRCPNAPSCNPAVIAQNLDDPDDIEADWTGIYFITHGANPATSGALNYCPLGGCQGPPQILIGGLSYVNALTLDQDAIYVVSSGSPMMGIAKP